MNRKNMINYETTGNTFMQDRVINRSKKQQSQLDSIDGSKLDIIFRHFQHPSPSVSQYQLQHQHHHIKIDQTQIHYITLDKLIEISTNPDMIHEQFRDLQEEILNILKYGYLFITDEKTLFTKLVTKYYMVPPPNLSFSENRMFIQTVIKVVQMNVLFLIQEWLQIYAIRKFMVDEQIKEIFMESLLLIYISRVRGKWLLRLFDKIIQTIKYSQQQYLQIVFPAEQRQQTNQVKSNNQINYLGNEWFKSYVLPLYKILISNRKQLANNFKQFDYSNLQKVTIEELVMKIKSGKKSTPNLDKISYYFNKLSDLVVFMVLFPKTNIKRIKVMQYFIDLIDELVDIYNYNSAFALYSGIVRSPLDRIKHLIQNKISKKHTTKLNIIQQLFSSDNNQIKLREAQRLAVDQCIPYLGVYFKDFIMIDESYSQLYKKKEGFIIFNKIILLSSVVKRIAICNDNETINSTYQLQYFAGLMENIVPIDEDYLYELSYMIEPIQNSDSSSDQHY